MSTQLQNYSKTQDALTLFFDLQTEKNSIKLWMNELFDEGQALYLTEKMDGVTLFNHLQKLLNDGEALLPMNSRILFCYYLPLEDLTEEWIMDFFERAETFKKFVPLENSFNQHYIICLSCATNHIPEDKHEELARLMLRLGKENPIVSHQIYLIRVAGFQEYTNQEHALVQMLHMLSREDYHKIRQPKAGSAIRMLDYADYYEDRALRCDEKIREINYWENQSNDHGLANTYKIINQVKDPAIDTLRNSSREFRKKCRVYPVRLNDFNGNVFIGFTSSVTANHPILQKRREEYTERKRQELIRSINYGSIEDFIKTTYCSSDYEELEEKINDGELKKEFVGKSDEYDREPEIKKLLEEMYGNLDKVLQAHVEKLPELKNDKQKEKRRYMKELQMAGQYKSLEDCFERICEDLKPKPIQGRFLQPRMTIALLSGKPLQDWNTKMYEIQGIHQAYKYPSIKPSEIVLLNESELVDLDDPNAVSVLKNVF